MRGRRSLVLSPVEKADDFDHDIDRNGVAILRFDRVSDVRRDDLVLEAGKLAINDAVNFGTVECVRGEFPEHAFDARLARDLLGAF
jgi:hypothetical protein